MSNVTVTEWAPKPVVDECTGPIRNMLHEKVLMAFDGRDYPWIGSHKNVTKWCVILHDCRYRAVGLNENTNKGASLVSAAVSRLLFHNLKETPDYACYAIQKKRLAKEST